MNEFDFTFETIYIQICFNMVSKVDLFETMWFHCISWDTIIYFIDRRELSHNHARQHNQYRSRADINTTPGPYSSTADYGSTPRPDVYGSGGATGPPADAAYSDTVYPIPPPSRYCIARISIKFSGVLIIDYHHEIDYRTNTIDRWSDQVQWQTLCSND